MNHPTLTLAWRLGSGRWLEERDFELLLGHVKNHPTAVDEIALFWTNNVHCYKPLSAWQALVAPTKLRMSQLRAAGIETAGKLLKSFAGDGQLYVFHGQGEYGRTSAKQGLRIGVDSSEVV